MGATTQQKRITRKDINMERVREIAVVAASVPVPKVDRETTVQNQKKFIMGLLEMAYNK